MISRRTFMGALLGSAGLGRSALSHTSLQRPSSQSKQQIDRRALVSRHNPKQSSLDPLSPLSLGNGEFAFTADITGLQTVSQAYENAMPLCTMSQWGWHCVPRPSSIRETVLRLTPYDTYGRAVGYQTSAEGQADLFNWLRENPHRLHLGRIGLYPIGRDSHQIQVEDITDVDQQLDLWQGVLTSKFKLYGTPVLVRTAVHPRDDLLAVFIESDLIRADRLGVNMTFPYGSPSMQAADWTQPTKHQTRIVGKSPNRVELQRILDADEYYVGIQWQGSCALKACEPHSFQLAASSLSSNRAASLEFVVAFSPQRIQDSLPHARRTFAASEKYWQEFWTQGAAVELAGSQDARAHELERRVVLSQYLTAIQCSGSKPPQETGLTTNSWNGKFHLEMHWWHAAHFALWNRLTLLERSLGWYESILASARTLARSQGYSGARWPKMVGPEGRDSPSPIGPLLIWQQPHPIFYAELCYQGKPNPQTLERFREIVFESAEFMVSYAVFDNWKRRYVLGPPLIPAQENHPPRETWNPTFELAYWIYGLKVAQLWRERLGLTRKAEWERVIDQLSLLPVRDGVYLAHENCPQTFTERNYDHPSMLAALGVLPGEGVDRETMRRTLRRTMKEWKWEQTWGWDFPMTAMTAARLGETQIAIDALLMTAEKNRYLPNGHNWQRPNLPCYLPGNGGLLYAIAMMAAGWRDGPKKNAPGFPVGSWKVSWEGLKVAI